MKKANEGDSIVVYGPIWNVETQELQGGVNSRTKARFIAYLFDNNFPREDAQAVEIENPKDGKRFTAHRNQCRRLVKKPRRRAWVGFNKYGVPVDVRQASHEGFVEFIEVRRKP
jgi:hypothetical protein